MADRLRVHAELSSWFADRSDADLTALLGQADGRTGWGVSRTVEVEGRRVFVKTLPITDLELANPYSTRNLFELPVFYSYGVGSAGFGSYRELAAHIKTTQWVMSGRIANFPLLYHHRLVPLAGQTRQMDADRLEGYVAYWNGDSAVRRFMEARQAATHAIALFVEHIPHVLEDWLPVHRGAVSTVIEQALAVTAFLRANGVAHLDAHASNILTDGTRLFFADFGLLLDDEFDLADDERSFLQSHRYYDIAEFIFSLDDDAHRGSRDSHPEYAQVLAPYREVISAMSSVFERLMSGSKKESGYDDSGIERLLAAVTG